ncbi:hypothetical protein ACLESO_59185, partial [Pyxidicoccus sp. 3LG]
MFLRPEQPAVPPSGEERQPFNRGPGEEQAPEVPLTPPPAPWEASGGATEVGGDEASRSPHPGFDRIRALASQRKHGGAEGRAAGHRKHDKRGPERPTGPGPRFPAPRPRPEAPEPTAVTSEDRQLPVMGAEAREAMPAAPEPMPVAPTRPEAE